MAAGNRLRIDQFPTQLYQAVETAVLPSSVLMISPVATDETGQEACSITDQSILDTCSP